MARNYRLLTALTTSATILLMPLSELSLVANQATLPPWAIAPAAFAVEATTYKPPLRPAPLGPTSGSGSRGCDYKTLPVPLTPIVPADHTGQTVSERPTFFWYLAAKTPVRFTLVEPGVPKPIHETLITPPKPGIMQVSLPEQAPALEVGKVYRWSITLSCSTPRPSALPYAQAWIQRVPQTAELEQQLKTAQSNGAKAQIYASAGLWFDALKLLSTAESQDEMLSLLDQVQLGEITRYERRNAQVVRP